MQNEIHRLIDQYTAGRMNRRELIASLATLVAIAGAGHSATAQEKPGSTFHGVGLNHLALRVTNVPRSRDFYIKHLGLKVARDGGENNCFLNFDEGFLALFRGEAAGMDHYCYSIKDYDVRGAEEKLKAEGLSPRVTSGRIYFNDPDGLTVQLAAVQHRP